MANLYRKYDYLLDSNKLTSDDKEFIINNLIFEYHIIGLFIQIKI